MCNISFYNANIQASKVLSKMQAIQAAINENFINLKSKDNQENLPPEEHVNSIIIETNIKHEMLKILKDMRNELNILKENGSSQKIPKAKTPYKRTITNTYFWTHGGCAHNGQDYRPNRKKDGHKDKTTFTNKIGGFIYFVKPHDSME